MVFGSVGVVFGSMVDVVGSVASVVVVDGDFSLLVISIFDFFCRLIFGDLVRLTAPATAVGLKPKLRKDKWKGPYKIIDKNNQSNVCIDINGSSKWVHISRVKSARTQSI